MLESTSSGSSAKALIGMEEAIMDGKGRILVSKKKRDRLGEPFVMAVDDSGCIVAYPEETWSEMVQEILNYRSLSQGRKQYTRLLARMAEDDLRFDAQGRVVIPQKFREAAKLNKEVVIVGCIDRVEIWAREEWEKFNDHPVTYGEDSKRPIERAYEQMIQHSPPSS